MLDTNIIRWDIVDESLWERVQEAEYGEFVFYEHHRYIVQELKNLIRELKDNLESARMEVNGYQEGLEVGTRIGMQNAVDVLKAETYK